MAGGDFERFYYRNVAISEGCGCAEQIIGSRDVSERAGAERAPKNLPRARHPGFRPSRLRRLVAFLRRLTLRP